MKRLKCVLIFKIGLLLPACTMVGPDYKEPKTHTASRWLKHDNRVKESRIDDAAWWSVFRDPNLTALIEAGYRNNLSLQSAGVRVLQARAKLAQSVGNLYPQQQALMGNYTYYRIGGSYLQDVLPSSFDAATLGLGFNWEIDFWGKYRRAIRANDAAFLASFAAYDQALVTLTADIASAYIKIRTNEALIQVTNENIALQTMGLKLTESRFKAGQVSLLDVQIAKTELAETQSSLPTLVSQLQTQKDALAVLLGLAPGEVDALLSKKQGIPKPPMTVAVGIPREALNRRPDIHQARLEAIAQSEAIGVAKANLYPAISLTGNFNFASNNISPSSVSDIFHWSNRNIIAGPAFNWPLLNYGQITNTVREQDAVFQEALLNYQDAVLRAQQEVQDNMTRYIEANKSEKYLVTADNAAIKAIKLTFIRYKEGESDYITVLNAEQQLLRVQTSLVKAEGEVPLALVSLYRALGGGWQIRKGQDIVPKEVRSEMAARTNWGDLLEQKNHQPPKTASEKMKQLYLPNA